MVPSYLPVTDSCVVSLCKVRPLLTEHVYSPECEIERPQSFSNDCLNTLSPRVISSSVMVIIEEFIIGAPFKLQVISTLGIPNPTQASKTESPTRAEVSLEIATNSS